MEEVCLVTMDLIRLPHPVTTRKLVFQLRRCRSPVYVSREPGRVVGPLDAYCHFLVDIHLHSHHLGLDSHSLSEYVRVAVKVRALYRLQRIRCRAGSFIEVIPEKGPGLVGCFTFCSPNILESSKFDMFATLSCPLFDFWRLEVPGCPSLFLYVESNTTYATQTGKAR